MPLKDNITADMKACMKSGAKEKLGTIRLILAAIKQIEVDERIELDDTRVLAVLGKMVKQRNDSLSQFSDAGRDDLVAVEKAEIEVIQDYLPEAMSDDEIEAIIKEAISTTGASSVKDMGKVMGIVKSKVQGRADMGSVSGKIKAILNAA